MRRTVRALSVAVLAGAACGAAGTAAARPGTTVTVSVTCGDRAEVELEPCYGVSVEEAITRIHEAGLDSFAGAG
ncbi:hypothetical protein ABZ372_04170, partial [Streptomyces sp. NPDC005921]